MRVYFTNLFSLLFLLASASYTNAIAENNHQAFLAHESHWTVASSNNFPPINLLDDKGELTGFAHDLSNAVLLELGIEHKHIHSSKWTDVLRWLDEGKADLIHDTGFTTERTNYLDFTIPIIDMPESIFVRDVQFNIHDFKGLANRKVACVRQHITHIYLKKFKEIDCYIVNTPAEGLIALINGNVSAFIYPEQIVLYLAQQLNLERKIKIIGKPLRNLSWSMTVKKGNVKVLNELNRGIKLIKENGEYDKVYNKWFGKRILSGFTKKEVYLITSVAVIFSVLTVLFLGLWAYYRKINASNNLLIVSERTYKSLVNNLPESIFLKDLNSVYLSCNKHFAENVNIEEKDIVGKTDYDIFPENASEYIKGDRKVKLQEKTLEFIESYTKNDGSKGYINTVKTPIHDEQGKLSGILGFYWDITEQHTLQKKLTATVNEYNTITATVPDVMYMLNRKGNFTWWNATFEKVTGLQSDMFGKLNALDVIDEKYHSIVEQSIQRVFEEGFAEVEADLLTTAGKKTYNFNGARLLDDKGNLLGLASSGRDMSKQQDLEKHQKELQAQLQQSQKMESIGQLTGGIAHDFNNILSAILGYSELALERLDKSIEDEKLRGYVEQISFSGKRARDLVSKMLTFSRTSKAEVKPVELHDFIDELILMLRPVIPTSIDLHREVEPGLPVLRFDPVMLQQLLVNLCINARDAIMENGVITISASFAHVEEKICDSCHHHFSGDFIQLTVEDTGEGIQKENINRIFEPFMTTKGVGKGTGMGLSMVHGITHEHDGHILVKSDTGKTSFAFYFPLDTTALDDALIKSETGELTPEKMEGHQHILVVDDEVALLEFFKEMLCLRGYKVTVENESAKALKAFEANPEKFDLVLTDQTMPYMSGKELAEKLLEIKPDLPIIMATGYSKQVDKNLAEGIGIKTFLKKPVDVDILLANIKKIFSSNEVP